MHRHIGVWFFIATLIASSPTFAQGGGRGAFTSWNVPTMEIVSVEPMENVPSIAGAPFTADATTEFTQMLSDGNRIERRFTTSFARDGRGRTRSEQDVAMLGPLGVLEKGGKLTAGAGRGAQNEPPRFTVISDPVEGVTYTLDERLKEARRNPAKTQMIAIVELNKLTKKLESIGRGDSPESLVVESLGTRQIEGISAEGTRSTTTIPAGQVGNLNPIHLVTERWFSKQLQMAVLITRRDPRSGETIYRLTNIVRAEPPPDLFTVPSDYRIVDLQKQVDQAKRQLEERKIRADQEIKKLEKAKAGQE